MVLTSMEPNNNKKINFSIRRFFKNNKIGRSGLCQSSVAPYPRPCANEKECPPNRVTLTRAV